MPYSNIALTTGAASAFPGRSRASTVSRATGAAVAGVPALSTRTAVIAVSAVGPGAGERQANDEERHSDAAEASPYVPGAFHDELAIISNVFIFSGVVG